MKGQFNFLALFVRKRVTFIGDSYGLCMKQIAKAHDIPYQIEAYAAGATDASFMQTLNGGIKSGGIQIPMRYVHSYEVCDIRDVVDSVELLYWYVKEAQI